MKPAELGLRNSKTRRQIIIHSVSKFIRLYLMLLLKKHELGQNRFYLIDFIHSDSIFNNKFNIISRLGNSNLNKTMYINFISGEI